MTNSKNMLWGCVALVAIVLVVSLAAGSAGYLLFALPCVLMMGGMMWMMMRGTGGGSEGADRDAR